MSYSVELRRATRAGQFFYTIHNPQGGSFGSNLRESRKRVLAWCARSIPSTETFTWTDMIGDYLNAQGTMAGTKVVKP